MLSILVNNIELVQMSRRSKKLDAPIERAKLRMDFLREGENVTPTFGCQAAYSPLTTLFRQTSTASAAVPSQSGTKVLTLSLVIEVRILCRNCNQVFFSLLGHVTPKEGTGSVGISQGG